MYRYDSIDRQLVEARAAQYRGQIERHLAGTLSEDELRPLRLQNGLYIQRHGPMLRIAIPYGQLAAAQLRKLADISRRPWKLSTTLVPRSVSMKRWVASDPRCPTGRGSPRENGSKASKRSCMVASP